MKRLPLSLALAAAILIRAVTLNAAPVVTQQLPGLTLYGDALPSLTDLNTAFHNPDTSAAVRMTTPFGDIDVGLYGDQKPITVANFLRYISEGRYFITDPTTQQLAPSFIHRSVSNFVIQGGGFLGTVNPSNRDAIQPTAVSTFAAIQNEPGISNKRGTIAMAKLGGDPNSATSQWFFNLADNSANLDAQNGGFTVFGRVVAGMGVVDQIAGLPVSNFGGAFDSLPLRNYTTPDPVRVANLVTLPSIAQISPLNFSAQSSNALVAEVRVSGKNLIVQGKQIGTARIVVSAADFNGATTTQSFSVTVVAAPGRLSNISTRGVVGHISQDQAMIGGFVLSGTGSKRVLIRALGPSLASANLTGLLDDPALTLRSATAQVATNDNWQTNANQQDINDLNLAPTSPREPAILTSLPASTEGTPYTAIVTGADDTVGLSLVEVYDVDSGPSPLILNISTRGLVGTGDNVVIGGFAVRGTEAKNIIVRGIGPSLAQFGVKDPLPDPTLKLFNQQGMQVDGNDNWQTSSNAAQIPAKYQPIDAHESVIMRTLAAGNYTAILSGTGNMPTGVGLVEVYQVQ